MSGDEFTITLTGLKSPQNESRVAETILEVLSTRAEVIGVQAEIQQLQARFKPTIHRQPTEPFSPAS